MARNSSILHNPPQQPLLSNSSKVYPPTIINPYPQGALHLKYLTRGLKTLLVSTKITYDSEYIENIDANTNCKSTEHSVREVDND